MAWGTTGTRRATRQSTGAPSTVALRARELSTRGCCQPIDSLIILQYCAALQSLLANRNSMTQGYSIVTPTSSPDIDLGKQRWGHSLHTHRSVVTGYAAFNARRFEAVTQFLSCTTCGLQDKSEKTLAGVTGKMKSPRYSFSKSTRFAPGQQQQVSNASYMQRITNF